MSFQCIKCIWHLLTTLVCHQFIFGLVMSHLDYINALLVILPDCDIKKFQQMQNMSAKLILQWGKYDSTRESLLDLHWLPIHCRIQFKMVVFVYKCMNNQALQYLSNLLVEHPYNRSGLRLNDMYQSLIIPFTRRQTFANRSFSVVGPSLWNKLPIFKAKLYYIRYIQKDLRIFIFIYEYADLRIEQLQGS